MKNKDFGTTLESIKHIGDMVDGKMVCREDCPSDTHMNTDLEDNIKSALSSNPDLRDKILALVAERDTYWKERVGEIRLLIAKYAKAEDMDVAGLVNEINTLCK